MTKESFSSLTGRHARAKAKPSCRPDWGSETGNGRARLGTSWGLRPPGYELPPLCGWGVPRDLQSVNLPLWAACGRCEGKPL